MNTRAGSQIARISLSVGLFLCVGFAECNAQLFKGGAQRRAARQGGGSYNAGSSTQQSQRSGLFGNKRSQPANSNQYQEPKTGLFGRPKEPKEKTGLFGRPKEEKSGGLFNRNKTESSSDGDYREKSGLFERARERREQEAYANQRYSNQQSQQRYTQQQMNQYASSSSVHRSQSAASNQLLFQASARSSVDAPKPGSAGGTVNPATIKTAVERAAQLKDSADPKSLPELARRKSAPETAPAKARAAAERAQAIVRSRPKLPRRTERPADVQKELYPELKDTSEHLPSPEPTGTLPAAESADQSPLATLA